MSTFILIWLFFLGLVIGSFLNCLVWRLYKEESLWGRSHCPKCLKQIAWYDNIPVLSFLFLRGRCRHCGQSISWQYPLVEFLSGILFVLVFLNFFNWQIPAPEQLLANLYSVKFWSLVARDLVAVSLMIAIFIYDARWFLISTLLILVGGGLVFGLDLLAGYAWYAPLISLVIGVAFFGLQYLLTRGRGIGEGDIWLGGLMGLIFPELTNLLLAIFASYIIGAIIGLVLIAIKKKGMKSQVPLGVFLALGTIISLFFGPELLQWYLGLL